MTGAEAQISRSDILGELAISENLKLDSDIFHEMQIVAANNSWELSPVVHIECDVCQCRTWKLRLQSNTCLPKPNGFFFVQGNWQLGFLGHLESCLTGQNYSNSCIKYPCEMFLIQLNPFRWLSGVLVTFFQLPWGQAEWPYKYETKFLDGVPWPNLHKIRAANHNSSIDWSERWF